MKKEIIELELELSSTGHLRFLTRQNALLFIKELHKNAITIYGFDGFNVGNNITPIPGFKISEMSIQPEQDFSRDYSTFTEEEAFRLCEEYFNKDKSNGTLYELSYNRN
jgi:hypothetical protein